MTIRYRRARLRVHGPYLGRSRGEPRHRRGARGDGRRPSRARSRRGVRDPRRALARGAARARRRRRDRHHDPARRPRRPGGRGSEGRQARARREADVHHRRRGASHDHGGRRSRHSPGGRVAAPLAGCAGRGKAPDRQRPPRPAPHGPCREHRGRLVGPRGAPGPVEEGPGEADRLLVGRGPRQRHPALVSSDPSRCACIRNGRRTRGSCPARAA